MFNRIESELKRQAKTKVWLAEKLGESTQNVNNWKTRGVPAAKVKRIAKALNITREYLEGDGWNESSEVSEIRKEYEIESINKKRYQVFVNSVKAPIKSLLGEYLQCSDGLSFVYATSWRHSEPFLELNIWITDEAPPAKTFLPLTNIVGIRSL